MPSYSVSGVFADYLSVIVERQLLDTALWKKCVDVFRTDVDNADAGWRGEYWGKMMRGACLVYTVSPSEALLTVLTDAVTGLLSRQEASGRISTYSADHEFYGWDMWSRKYVMTGLQHFSDICPDDALKDKILTALKSHAGYIIDRIGEGKLPILETGQYWGGVNSASILEPFVRLYKDTGDERYLAFSEYIVSTGGCRDGNLLECALSGKAPFEFPEQKAYETMSFFEGILALYEVTAKPIYLEAVTKFVDALLRTDVTVIGCCGCKSEQFDNSTLRQTIHSEKIMQETCVTVTLMRLLARLFNITKDKRLTDTIQLSAVNALAGALNVQGYEQFCNEQKRMLPGLLFDSYSPLCDSKRGLGIGGFKNFPDDSYFGCCACIASAGFGLYPMMSVTEHESMLSVNYLQNGVYRFENSGVALTISDECITVGCEKDTELTIRITGGTDSLSIGVQSEKSLKKCDGYTVLSGIWKDSEVISLTLEKKLFETKINDKLSLSYGGFTLAADTKKTDYRPAEHIEFLRDAKGNILYSVCKPEDGEQIRLKVETAAHPLILTDYAAAGQDGKSILSVWFS